MKTIVFLLGVAPLLAFAASDLERELQQLTADRDHATVAASESINAKYLASLHALLRRATQSKDSQSAAQITDAIGRVTAIGTWSVVCDNGYRTNLSIRTDGTFFGSNGNSTGPWNIRGGKLLIINPTSQDIYDLPMNNKMTGVTTKGVTMTAIRISK